MAKGSSSKTGSSKVRLIVFEAEMSDGDISQFTQAIQNALQPRGTASRVIQASPKALSDATGVIDDEDEAVEEQDFDLPKPRPARSSKPRAIKPPKVVEGVDWDKKSPSIHSFMDEYDFKTDFERFLAVALWFRDYRDTPAITPGHAYTAFRHLGWSTSIPDFAKPFRNMVQNQLFTGGSKEGFSINQLGEGKIKAKKRAAS